MICVNELTELGCNKRDILSGLVVLISPYTPHLAEELWEKLGNNVSITKATFPLFNPDYIVEHTFEYPVSFNGKMRFKLELALNLSVKEVETAVLNTKESQKWLQGNPPKKIVVVPRKIINVVI